MSRGRLGVRARALNTRRTLVPEVRRVNPAASFATQARHAARERLNGDTSVCRFWHRNVVESNRVPRQSTHEQRVLAYARQRPHVAQAVVLPLWLLTKQVLIHHALPVRLERGERAPGHPQRVHQP